MMKTEFPELKDVIILGGGLAGLTLAIQVANAGRQVVVIEKEKYPFHRVCGEYIAMESWDFLLRLGFPLQELQLPVINQLNISASNGSLLHRPLRPGGFGISRYLLDSKLAALAVQKGVILMEQSKAEDVAFENDQFKVRAATHTLYARVVVGAFGKRSNLDKRLTRSYLAKSKQNLNWVGVKYHIQSDLPNNVIQLHNFDGGYCGISKVEKDAYCLCYLTKAENLKKFAGDIAEMETTLLSQNPFLKKIFSDRSAFLFRQPVTISQINFETKEPVENHILMAGDAAGLIAPLCGNGMSMAMHAAAMCYCHIEAFLTGKSSRATMEQQYALAWKKEFSFRLKCGKWLQPLLVNKQLSKRAIGLLKHLPLAVDQIVKTTHGAHF